MNSSKLGSYTSYSTKEYFIVHFNIIFIFILFGYIINFMKMYKLMKKHHDFISFIIILYKILYALLSIEVISNEIG